MLRSFLAEVVPFGGVFALQVNNIGALRIDVHISIAGADTTVASFDCVHVEWREKSLELDSRTVAVSEVPPNPSASVLRHDQGHGLDRMVTDCEGKDE